MQSSGFPTLQPHQSVILETKHLTANTSCYSLKSTGTMLWFANTTGPTVSVHWVRNALRQHHQPRPLECRGSTTGTPCFFLFANTTPVSSLGTLCSGFPTPPASSFGVQALSASSGFPTLPSSLGQLFWRTSPNTPLLVLL
jgi:hypothetical protein